ncbi:thioredoxin family protein [Candidatus Babeliales bacterium]|nr:thioredoxin family protein [Candidatus Babeliales bacterium]
MKFSKLYIVFIAQILYFCPSSAHVFAAPDEILDLTHQELSQMIQNNEPTVIMGYMTNCPHCSKLQKGLQPLARKYPNANFYIVNGPEKQFHKKIAALSKFSIPGYPSTIFIKNGQIQNVQIGGNEKILEENVKKLIK